MEWQDSLTQTNYEELSYNRNTPSRKNGLSPVQKLYGHPIQDTCILPAHNRSFAPEQQHSIAEATDHTFTTLENNT